MYLKSLEITGFKSFAKKCTLDFSQAITSIVGPNGSGKSNTAEAFRFVLGEQSIKSLRGKRGEDLIFNGTPQVPKSNRAHVKITFDNNKRILNVDFDEVTIERTVHRDGVNDYAINGSPVRLKDITEMLAGAHIGSSGHHIISQGEADRVLNASIKERKSIIEDALGLNVYHYKIDESEKKLVKTEENIREVGILRREIAPHLRFLKKQVEKVEQTKKLREELSERYRDYLKREDIYLKHKKQELTEARHDPETKLKALDIELSAARETLEASSSENVATQKLRELEQAVQTLRQKKDSLLRDLGKVEGEISSYKNIRSESTETEQHTQIPMSRLDEFRKTLSEHLEKAESAQEISAFKQAVEQIRGYVKSFFASITSRPSEQQEKIQAALEVCEDERKKIESDLEKLKAEEVTHNEAYKRLAEEIEQSKEGSREAEKAVLRIRADRQEVERTLDAVIQEERILRIAEEAFTQELKEGMVLVGQAITQFKDHAVLDDAGGAVSSEYIIGEDRQTQNERRHNLEKIKIRLEDTGSSGGEDVLKEFEETRARDEFLEKELLDLETSKTTLLSLIAELKEKLETEFKTGIEKINKEFQNFFMLMFGGGQARLDVVSYEKRRRSIEEGDEEEGGDVETEEGVDVYVSLPRKKIKGLMMLSGGERALTSIALLFAMSQVNPPPFVILDETDAALDEANSRKYADMVESLSKHSQLILITHNRETMSRAGILYGVTMGASGASTILSIKFDEAVQVAK